MKKVQYQWFFFCPDDILAVEERLNALAKKGWELKKGQDGWHMLARFQRTERTELCYSVERAPLLRDAEEIAQEVERHEKHGWEAVGTVNGMDIYASSPCQAAEKLLRKKVNYTMEIVALAVICVASVTLCGELPRFMDVWYLGNLSAYLTLSFAPVSYGWRVWILSRLLRGRVKTVRMWISSLLMVLFCAWTLLLPICVLLDWLPVMWACGVIITAIIALSTMYFALKQRGKSLVALVLGLTLVTSLALKTVRPVQERYSVGSAPWRSSLTDVVTAEALDRTTGDFVSAEYSKQGSILVQRTAYSERWKELRLEYESYHCFTKTLAKLVEQDVKAQHPSWTITTENNTVRCLWVSEPIQ